MLQLQKIFLLVRFFNRISCNKGLKAKILRFFTCFFCLTSLRLECSRSRKTASFLMSQAEEIQKSASTELRELRENVVNVENCQFLRENCEFLLVI